MLGAVTATVGAASGPLLYAFTLGLVAAVNPCGFPLLPAYLAFFVGEPTTERTQRTLRGLGAGASATVGFVAVFALLGILVHAGIDVALGWVPWVMIPVGLAMVAIGVAAWLGRPLPWAIRSRRLGSGRGALAMVGFGVTYAVASLTCALPLFLAAVAGSFGRLGDLQGVGTFVSYALGMGLLLTVAGVTVAVAGVDPLRRLGAFIRWVPRVAGAVLVLVGAYLTFYWSSYLADPTASPPPIGLVEHVQTSLSDWLSGSPRLIGGILAMALVVTLALVVAALAGRRPKVAVDRDTPPTRESVKVGG